MEVAIERRVCLSKLGALAGLRIALPLSGGLRTAADLLRILTGCRERRFAQPESSLYTVQRMIPDWRRP